MLSPLARGAAATQEKMGRRQTRGTAAQEIPLSHTKAAGPERSPAAGTICPAALWTPLFASGWAVRKRAIWAVKASDIPGGLFNALVKLPGELRFYSRGKGAEEVPYQDSSMTKASCAAWSG